MWVSIWDPVVGVETQVETGECVVVYEQDITKEEAIELHLDDVLYASPD